MISGFQPSDFRLSWAHTVGWHSSPSFPWEKEWEAASYKFLKAEIMSALAHRISMVSYTEELSHLLLNKRRANERGHHQHTCPWLSVVPSLMTFILHLFLTLSLMFNSDAASALQISWLVLRHSWVKIAGAYCRSRQGTEGCDVRCRYWVENNSIVIVLLRLKSINSYTKNAKLTVWDKSSCDKEVHD